MKTVVLCCSHEDNPFFMGSILGRNDIEVRHETDIERSVNEVIKAPPDLFVICDYEGASLELHLHRIARYYGQVPFPTAIVSEGKPDYTLPAHVMNIIPRSVAVGDFNDIMADLLGIRTRRRPGTGMEPLGLPRKKSGRFLVRIGPDMSKPERTFVATAENLKPTGLTLVSYKLLLTGKMYQMTFIRTKKGGGLPVMSVRISKEKLREEKLGGKKVYSAEFVEPKPAEMAELLEKMT